MRPVAVLIHVPSFGRQDGHLEPSSIPDYAVAPVASAPRRPPDASWRCRSPPKTPAFAGERVIHVPDDRAAERTSLHLFSAVLLLPPPGATTPLRGPGACRTGAGAALAVHLQSCRTARPGA